MSVDRRVMKAAILLAFLAVGAILYFAAVAFTPSHWAYSSRCCCRPRLTVCKACASRAGLRLPS